MDNFMEKQIKSKTEKLRNSLMEDAALEFSGKKLELKRLELEKKNTGRTMSI